MKRTEIILTFLLVVMIAPLGAQCGEVDVAALVRILNSGRVDDLEITCDRLLSDGELTIRQRCVILNFKEMALTAQSKIEESLSLNNSLIEMDKPDSLRYFDIRAYLAMSGVFAEIGQFDMALRALDCAQDLMRLKSSFPAAQPRRMSAMLMISRSLLAERSGEIMQALAYWRECESESLETPSLRLMWLTQGGNLYRKLGNMRKAYEMYSEALALGEANPNSLEALVAAMELLNEAGKFEEALSLGARYAKFQEFGSDKMLKYRLNMSKAEAYDRLGLNREGLECTREAAAAAVSAIEAQKQAFRTIVADKVDKVEYASLRRLHDSARRREALYVLVSGAGGLVLIVLIIIWGRVQRRYHRKKSELISLSESAFLTVDGLQTHLADSNHNLNSMCLHDEMTNSAIDRIRKELNSDKPREDKLRSVRVIIQRLSHEKAVCDSFEMRWKRENNRFITKMLEMCPSLSQSELTVALMILAGHSTKDMAFRLDRSVRTVEGIKYSLRKKLGITGPTDVFIRQVDQSIEGGQQDG